VAWPGAILRPPAASRLLAAVILCFLLLQLWRAAGPEVKSDERHYYFSARQMASGGSWLTPVDQHRDPRLHKPPLFTWLTAALFKLTGPSLFVLRLLPILAAAASAWVLRLLILLLTGSRLTAGLGAIIFLGSTELIVTSGQGRMDSLLLLLIITANYLFLRILTDRPGKLAASLLAYLCLGLAFLTKGPQGILQTVVPAALTALLGPGPKGRLLHLLHPLGWLVLAGLILPWYLALLKVHGPAAWPLITGDLAKHGPSARLPVHLILNLARYLPALMISALPWWPFLLLPVLARSRPGPAGGRVLSGPAGLFPLLWLAAAALSLLPGSTWYRRYLILVLPVLALYGAWSLEALQRGPAWIREKALPWTFRGLVLVAAAYGLVLVIGRLRFGPLLTTPRAFPLLTAAAILGLGLCLWRSPGRGLGLRAVTLLALLNLVVTASYERNYAGPSDRPAVARLAAEVIRPLEGERLALYALGLKEVDWAVVADRGGYWPLERWSVEDPGQWPRDRLFQPDGEGRRVLAVTTARHLEKLDRADRERLEVVDQRTHRALTWTFPGLAGLGSRTAVLVRPRPEAGGERGG